jgi:AraC-like DNA-binding protein
VSEECEAKAGGSSDSLGKPVSPVRAARLHEIKTDILGNLRHQGLTIHGIASRHGLSASYVKQLFSADGTTFTEFVLRQRVSVAAAMLRDPHYAEHSIAAIAFEAGFGDVGYFNRIFRRRVGLKPADARSTLRKD